MAGSLKTGAMAALVATLAFWCAFAQPPAVRAATGPCSDPAGGFGFDTFELENYTVDYSTAIELAVQGKGTPPPYTIADGERIDVSYQGLEAGPRSARLPASAARSIPPSVYKSIVWVESNYANADAGTYFGMVGGTLRSFDCGYGLSQVTTGMGHLGAPPAYDIGVPSAQQAIIGTDFVFNLAAGVKILADKWNGAPNVRPVAGDGDPSNLEDWYYAIWSYNGFAFSNHPLNPDRDPLRGGGTTPIYHCYDPYAPSYQSAGSGGVKYGYGDYTYPERVYGCMRFPPVSPGKSLQPPLGTTPPPTGPKFAVGDVGVVFGTGNCLNVRSMPSAEGAKIGCLNDGTPVTILGGPTAGSGITWWNVHTPLGDGWSADQFLKNPNTPEPTMVVNPEGRIWLPQVFTMPNLSNPLVAKALDPLNFLSCSDAPEVTGCSAMDFPTVIPGVKAASVDSTPPIAAALAAKFLGDPTTSVIGPESFTLAVSDSGTTGAGTVTVKNTGTWIAPFRVRTSDSWIVVRHPGAGHAVDGGVAIGAETEVVTQKANAAQGKPRLAQKGYDSVLEITVDPTFLAKGKSTGTVYIDPLLGSGPPVAITVTVNNTSTGTGGLPPPPRNFKAYVPGLASGDE